MAETVETFIGDLTVEQQLTPRQLAQATGVSESSIKRWCDAGEIATVRTPGGHRRIPMSEAVQFLRAGEHALLQPQLLGLPAATKPGSLGFAQAREQLQRALLAGEVETCRRILFELYLGPSRLSEIGDQVIAPAFAQIGHCWETGEAEIFQERRAFEVTRNLLHELRLSQSPPTLRDPLALGGAIAGDHYALAPSLVELVLREGGWRASFLGSHLPVDTLASAIVRHQPRLFWLSVSHIDDEARFLEQYAQLQAVAEPHTAVVVGGRALHAELRRQMDYAAHCETLRNLETFAQTWRAAVVPQAKK